MGTTTEAIEGAISQHAGLVGLDKYMKTCTGDRFSDRASDSSSETRRPFAWSLSNIGDNADVVAPRHLLVSTAGEVARR